MAKKVLTECYCRSCEHEEAIEYRAFECPVCGSKDLWIGRFIVCDCGEKVYVNRFTNECSNCGRLYSRSGEELAPPSNWDDDDRYACFGPQDCYEEVY